MPYDPVKASYWQMEGIYAFFTLCTLGNVEEVAALCRFTGSPMERTSRRWGGRKFSRGTNNDDLLLLPPEERYCTEEVAAKTAALVTIDEDFSDEDNPPPPL